MSDPTVVHSTFVLTRIYSKPPAKVFAAFSDPGKKRRWYADNRSNETVSYELDFRPGGAEHARFRMSPTTPFPGTEIVNDGYHLDIVTDRRIVAAHTMAMAGRRFSAALTTFEFRESGGGTELVFIHQGVFFEGADGPKMREEGWRKLLDNLGSALAD